MSIARIVILRAANFERNGPFAGIPASYFSSPGFLTPAERAEMIQVSKGDRHGNYQEMRQRSLQLHPTQRFKVLQRSLRGSWQ
jgi:hypothetical protein